jgi:nucleotide-binding universal stress UspA family protein
MALATAYVPPVPGQAILWEDRGEELSARCQEVLESQAKALPTAAETLVLSGRVDLELADLVGDSALLVLGSAAERGLAGKFIGDTAEKVLHYLATDLLIVH